MSRKKEKILKKSLTSNEVELVRKSCRALNMLLDVRRKNITCKNTLLKSITYDFNNICINNKESAHLLNSVIIFNENKLKFKLNWK